MTNHLKHGIVYAWLVRTNRQAAFADGAWNASHRRGPEKEQVCSLLLSKSGSSPFQVFALHLFHCLNQNNIALSPAAPWEEGFIVLFLCGGWGRMGAGGRYKAIPHNSKCRYGERGAADAKPKAQIILDVLSSILATQMPCRSCRSGA